MKKTKKGAKKVQKRAKKVPINFYGLDDFDDTKLPQLEGPAILYQVFYDA